MSELILESYLKAKVLAEILSVESNNFRLAVADVTTQGKIKSKINYIHAEILELRILVEKELLRVRKQLDADVEDFSFAISEYNNGRKTTKRVSKAVATKPRPKCSRKTV